MARRPAAPSQTFDDNYDRSETRPAISEDRQADAKQKPANKLNKQIRLPISETARSALAKALAANMNLALAFLVARLGCAHGGQISGVECSREFSVKEEPQSRLLRSIRHQSFPNALRIVQEADLSDLIVAFCELIASAVDMSKTEMDGIGVAVAAASRLSDMGTLMRETFDYEAYFSCANRAAAIGVIRDLSGEAEATRSERLKRAQLGEKAAVIAKDKGWLPDVFAEALGEANASSTSLGSDEPSCLAAASMASNLDDSQETNRHIEPGSVEEATKGPTETASLRYVSCFLTQRCRHDNDAQQIKASALKQAFDAFGAEQGWTILTPREFSEAISALGIEKRRKSTGWHYLHLAMRLADSSARKIT
jgi:ParB family chromosome partitioning protein